MFGILYSMMTIHVREDLVTGHQQSGGTSILGGDHGTLTQILNRKNTTLIFRLDAEKM